MKEDHLKSAGIVVGICLGLTAFATRFAGLADDRLMLAAAVPLGALAVIVPRVLGAGILGERFAGVFLAAAMTGALLLVPEMILRGIGFRYESGIQFGWPRPEHFTRLAPHPELFWTLPPGEKGVNSLGFPGSEIVTPTPHDTFRILYLGDSCTQEGYPEEVTRLLAETHADGEPVVDPVNLSISGYPSDHGVRLARAHGATVDPDVVVVYYGWNDPWRAYGATDEEKVMPAEVARPNPRFEKLRRHLRLLRGVRQLSDRFGGAPASSPIDEVRVPLAQYRANLAEILATFPDVPVVLITAPTAYYSLGVPPYLTLNGFVPDPETAITRHRAYVEMVRELITTANARLLDLEAEFADGDDLARIFREDGVHFTPEGATVVAERLCAFLRGAGLLEAR